jgi:hypothetical protein
MPPPAGRFSAAAYRAYLLRRHRRRRFPDGSLAEQKQRAISHAVISAGNEVSPRKVMSKSMDIRKVVLGGFVAATAVVLPVSAASAALATPAPPPPPPKTNCIPPKPPAPPKPPKHHRKHDGDNIKPGGGGLGGQGIGGQQGGWNKNKHKTPPPPPVKHNHKPGTGCTCKPGHQAPPPFYSIFEPPCLSALYQTETWSYTCPPGKGWKP